MSMIRIPPPCYPPAFRQAVLTRYPLYQDSYDPVRDVLNGMSAEGIIPVPTSTSITGPLTVSYFPRELIMFAEKLSEESRIDLVGCLCSILGGVNNALRGVYFVQPEDTWQEPLIDYWLVLAPPSMMKTFIERQIKAPFHKFEKKLEEEFSSSFLDEKAVKDRLKFCATKAKKYLGSLMSKLGDDPSPQEIKDVYRQAEKYHCELKAGFADAIAPRIFWQAGTMKGLAGAMSEQHGCIGIIVSEESFLTENLLCSHPDQELFLRGWDQGTYNRTVEGKIREVRKTSLPILMIVQNVVGTMLFSHKHLSTRGAASRFLTYWVPSGPRRELAPSSTAYLPGYDSDATLRGTLSIFDRYCSRIEKLLHRSWDARKEDRFIEIKLSPEAKKFLHDKQGEFECKRNSQEYEFLADWLGKAHGFLLRIAGDIHCWSHPEYPENSPITVEEIRAADELLRILSIHAEYSFSPNGVSMLEDIKKIIRYVKKLSPFPVYVDSCIFYQNIRGLNANKVANALECMERLNQLRVIPKKRSGSFVIFHPNLYCFLTANKI